VTLDVFLTAFRGGEEVAVDRNALESALAHEGLGGGRTTVTTSDGGAAQLLVDDDGASFLVQTLTPELSQLIFEVAREARLVTLPADGTPNAYVVDRALVDELPHDLEASVVEAGSAFHEVLRASEEARGARTS
jgi:hypothetical protein